MITPLLISAHIFPPLLYWNAERHCVIWYAYSIWYSDLLFEWWTRLLRWSSSASKLWVQIKVICNVCWTCNWLSPWRLVPWIDYFPHIRGLCLKIILWAWHSRYWIFCLHKFNPNKFCIIFLSYWLNIYQLINYFIRRWQNIIIVIHDRGISFRLHVLHFCYHLLQGSLYVFRSRCG